MVLTALVVAGPRITLDDNAVATMASNPDIALIAGREGAKRDIVPGTEKAIRWFEGIENRRTGLAIVYLHGFSATRRETHPLTDHVADALGANVFYTRLAGHGRDSAALGEATATDWLHDAREALAIGNRIGERVLVVGVSTGATLAIWLAARVPQAPDGLVLISPNLGLANRTAFVLTLPWGVAIAERLNGPTYSFEPSSPDHGRYWTTSYPVRVTAEMMSLVDLVNRFDPARIDVPVLYLRSDRDRVIDMSAADRFFDRLGSTLKEKRLVTGSDDPWGHVIAGDILSPSSTGDVATMIVEFARSLEQRAVN